MRKKVTIKDIAKELGIHHTTVSLALRNSGSIREETRERVWKKAREMGYRPNRLAQDFRNRRSSTVGVLVPSIRHHFFAKFIAEITERAGETGFSVMVFQSNERRETEKRNVETLIDNRVAGVIASISKETTDPAHFELFLREEIPLVFFDRVPEMDHVSRVLTDNFRGAYDAVSLMIRAGRRRIAFITGASHLNVYHDRLQGYRKALEDHGLPFSEQWLVVGDFFMEDGIRGAAQLMSLSRKPDAILAVGDDVGIGAIKYLKSAGYRIPQDVAVVGFDNDPMGQAIDPELTTVEQPIAEMAEASFSILSEQILSGKREPVEKTLSPRLLIRESCVYPMVEVSQ